MKAPEESVTRFAIGLALSLAVLCTLATGWSHLTEGFERVTESEREEHFIPRGEIQLPRAASDYSAAGNRFVAERLYKRLKELGVLATKR